MVKGPELGTLRIHDVLPFHARPPLSGPRREERRIFHQPSQPPRGPRTLLGLLRTGDSRRPRDASAAAVTASALLELAKYVPEKEKLYYKTAKKILHSLASDRYLIPAGKKNGFLIDHSVGSKPGKSQVDVPIIYGDYYFLEALLRLKNYKSHK